MLFRTFEDLSVFVKRREQLGDVAGDAVFILFSGEEGHLTQFRPQSHFVYLTGFEEPQAVAVIRTGKKAQFSLFVREKNPNIEIWDGERFGPEKAQQLFGVDQCFEIGEFTEQLPYLLQEADKIYFSLGGEVAQDELVLQGRDQAQQLDRRSGQAKKPICDPNEVLASMRMVKDSLEIELLRESCRLSAEAHIHVMKNVKPNMNERQVLAHLLFSFYNQEASREGYSSIIASGANACTLHYRANCRQMQDGDFLLIDAGAEKSYFTADITRTYPVNGKFTEPQRKVYQAVLDVQKKLIELVREGFSLPQLHEKSVEWLTEKMVELNLLSGSVQENIENKRYHKYYPHGVGHYLGMDVHDVGVSKKNGQPVPFKAGTVITVEPGLYVPSDDMSAPEEFRGLGVRIEDDVLVTASEPEVLTALVPKEIEELEAIIGKN